MIQTPAKTVVRITPAIRRPMRAVSLLNDGRETPRRAPLARSAPGARVELGRLEVHVAHACNLTCESCAHFSNGGHRGILTLGEFEANNRPWTCRLRPAIVCLLGGEPTLNPKLGHMLKSARAFWRDSEIALTTNGFFLDRHPELGAVLAEVRASVILTRHDVTEAYTAAWQKARDTLLRWRDGDKFGFRDEVSYDRWTRRHRGVGPGVMPYGDGDPARSWAICPARDARQLFRGKLWKCAPIAYLRLQKERYPELSPAWDTYLAYEPLGPDCGEAELREFLERREEPICAMCPAVGERFERPSPLIPVAEVLRGLKAKASANGHLSVEGMPRVGAGGL